MYLLEQAHRNKSFTSHMHTEIVFALMYDSSGHSTSLLCTFPLSPRVSESVSSSICYDNQVKQVTRVHTCNANLQMHRETLLQNY